MKSRVLGVAGLLIWVAMGANTVGAKQEHAEHAKETVAVHRAIAQAHTDAAKCLEAGKAEKECHAEMAKQCKGLAIGKYCGMKHHH